MFYRSILMGFAMLILISQAFTQLHCKIITDNNKAIIKTWFHQNGKPSSIETWDAAHRSGTMKCYNAAGEEIINHWLRSFGGHASVYLDYFSNGQVKKVEYSSAPDGGIQFWRIIYTFDERGNLTSKTDLSEPDGHPVLMVPDFIKQPSAVVKPVEQKVMYTTFFEVVNKTNSKVLILMKALSNKFAPLKDSVITLKGGRSILLDSLVLAEQFLPPAETYEPLLLTRKNKCILVAAQPLETQQQRRDCWYILKK